MLIKGENLNKHQLKQVSDAFIYRWTYGNERRKEAWSNNPYKPTCDLESDAVWVLRHAFHFLKDGSRLMKNRPFCEPEYMAD